MNKRIFVCSSIYNNELISKAILASSYEEANIIFKDQYTICAKEILGPFHFDVKNKKISNNVKVLKFSDNKLRKAIYNDWIVNAFFLSEPIDHAFLVFINRIDDKKIPSPKGTIIVPTYNLRFINNNDE